MGTGGDTNQNSILKGILQNGSKFNYPGKEKKLIYKRITSEKELVNMNNSVIETIVNKFSKEIRLY